MIRDLAKRYMDVAMSDRHVRMRERFRATNDLRIVRPPLIMEEIPWHEMQLDECIPCVCEDPNLRHMEQYLRLCLYRDRTC